MVPFVVVRMSRALRDQAVCRSKLFIEFGDNSVSMIGVERSALFGARKLKLLSYGLFGSVVVVECVKRVFECVAVGNGVRERRGNVSTNGVEPNGVGVLLRGLSRRKLFNRSDDDDEEEEQSECLPFNFDAGYRVSISSFSYATKKRKEKKFEY